MNTRRAMHLGDWLNGAVISVVGVYAGLFFHHLFKLSGATFWVLAIGTPLVLGGVFLFSALIDRLVDKIFPSFFTKPTASKPKEPKPLAIFLFLPAGILIGLIGAKFGLAELIS